MSGQDTFTIRSKQFDGPLDLLLDLVEQRKMHVSDISLSQITDSYLAYLENTPFTSNGEMAEFVSHAATLLLIKSRALLPTLQVTDEELTSINDLEDRLERLASIRGLSEHIRDRFGETLLYGREACADRKSIAFVAPQNLSTELLRASVQGVIKAMPVSFRIPLRVVARVVSLEEIVVQLAERVQRQLQVRFSDFVAKTSERTEIILGFLALLELVKRGSITVCQDNSFSDIQIETQQCVVPRYG